MYSNPIHTEPSTEINVGLPYEEYPFQSRFIDIAGNNIHYIDEGEGPTLLFVHAPFWSIVFRDVIKALRSDFRCVALDFPGTGFSEPSEDYQPTMPDAAAVLEGFVRALTLDTITLVAHDIGGGIGLGAVRKMPRRFVGLAVTGSFAWPLEGYPDITRMLRIVGGPVFGGINAHINFLARLSATSFGVGRRLSKEGKSAFLTPFRSTSVRRTATTMLGNAAACDDFLADIERSLKSELSRLPTLLVYGEKDEGRLAGFQDHFERLLPHADSFVVEGAHHFPQMDAPHAVAGYIRNWWDRRVHCMK